MNILDQPAVPQAEKCVPAVTQAAQAAAVLVCPQDGIVQFNVVPLYLLSRRERRMALPAHMLRPLVGPAQYGQPCAVLGKDLQHLVQEMHQPGERGGGTYQQAVCVSVPSHTLNSGVIHEAGIPVQYRHLRPLAPCVIQGRQLPLYPLLSAVLERKPVGVAAAQVQLPACPGCAVTSVSRVKAFHSILLL